MFPCQEIRLVWFLACFIGCATLNIVPPAKQDINAAASWSRDLRGMVLFIGYGRTGSSLVAAMLDAHPKVVITNELDLVNNLHDSNGQPYTANQIYTAIYTVAKDQAKLRKSGGGYQYQVPGQWQGMVKGKLPLLIGDKKAEATSKLGTEKLTEALRDLTAVTGLPLKLIYVGRNPFENFATRSVKKIYDHNDESEQRYFDSVENGTMAPNDMSDYMDGHFQEHYFEVAKTNQEIMDILKKDPNYFGAPAEIVEVDYEDLIRDAPNAVRRLCNQLGIACTEDYINATTNLIWPTYHYTRFNVRFGQGNICNIMKRSFAVPHLRRYMLSSTVLPPSSKVACGTECFPGASPCPCDVIKACQISTR